MTIDDRGVIIAFYLTSKNYYFTVIKKKIKLSIGYVKSLLLRQNLFFLFTSNAKNVIKVRLKKQVIVDWQKV